jgi:hypothetical protein
MNCASLLRDQVKKGRIEEMTLKGPSHCGLKDPGTWTGMGKEKEMSEKQICLIAYRESYRMMFRSMLSYDRQKGRRVDKLATGKRAS